MKFKLHEKLIMAVLKKVGQLSLPAIYRLTCLIYFMMRLVPLNLKKTILRNVTACFPDLNKKAQKKIVNQAVFHTLWRLLEMAFFWFSPLKRQDSIPLIIEGETEFQDDFAKGQGAILVMAHFGGWEMLNAYIGRRYPSVALYKPFKKAYQRELIVIARQRYGVDFFETSTRGVKNIFKALKQGKVLGVLADHDPGHNGGMFVPFFGIPANTAVLTAKLIQKSQAPVYSLAAERLPKGRGFRIRFKKIITPATVSLEELTQQMNQAIEAIIQYAPEQYEWSYKRFRRTPTETGKPFYMEIS